MANPYESPTATNEPSSGSRDWDRDQCPYCLQRQSIWTAINTIRTYRCTQCHKPLVVTLPRGWSHFFTATIVMALGAFLICRYAYGIRPPSHFFGLGLVWLVGCQPSDVVVSLDEMPTVEAEVSHTGVSSSMPFAPRWPTGLDGEWLTASDERLGGLRLSEVELVSMLPLPDYGYVPVECMGPTIRSAIHNQTRFEIADIRIRVQAFRESDGVILANEVTDIPGKYRTTLPNSIAKRKFVLRDNGMFVNASEWPQFKIEATLVAVRIWDYKKSEAEPIKPSDATERRSQAF